VLDKSITQQLSQKDQDRLKDFKADSIAGAVDQLKQAYKDKYQQDLDFSKNADQIFTAQSFQISASGDARTASERIGADAASAGNAANAGAAAAAQKDAAGVGAAARQGGQAGADAAQAAGAAVAGSASAIAVAIPASGDVPEAKLNLVKEGSAWKVNLPDSIDAQQLSQRLNDHISMVTKMKDQWPADANEASRAISHHVFVALSSDTGAGAAGAGAGTGAAGGTGASGTSNTSGAAPGAAGTGR
jgi:hypothetical protein